MCPLKLILWQVWAAFPEEQGEAVRPQENERAWGLAGGATPEAGHCEAPSQRFFPHLSFLLFLLPSAPSRTPAHTLTLLPGLCLPPSIHSRVLP